MSQGRFGLAVEYEKDGTKTSLEKMTLEGSEAFKKFLSAFINIAKQYKKEDIRIEIKDGSASITAVGEPDTIAKLKKDYDTVIEGKSKNKALIRNWGNIHKVFQANGLTYSANYNGVNITETILSSNKGFLPANVDSSNYKLTFLQGSVKRIGGGKPTILFLPNNQTKQIRIRCSKSEAKRIDTYLYSKLSLSIWAKEIPGKRTEYTFCDYYALPDDFKYFNVVVDAYYKKSNSMAKLEFLHDEFNTLMKREKKFASNVVKFLRIFNHDSLDSGTLKTLLVLTKSLQGDKAVKIVRQKVKKRLEVRVGKLY